MRSVRTPGPRRGGRARRARTVPATVLVGVVAMTTAACGGGGGRTFRLDPEPTAVVADTSIVAPPRTTAAGTVTTVAARSGSTGAGSTGARSTGAGSTGGGTATTARPGAARTTTSAGAARAGTTAGGGRTTTTIGDAGPGEALTARCNALATDPAHTSAPTLPDGRVATSAEHRVRLSYPSGWRVDAVTVSAGQVLAPEVADALGLAADARLQPLAVRAPATFPGVAVFRFRRPDLSLGAITALTRIDLRRRGFVVRQETVADCLDTVPTVGLVGANPTAVEGMWFAMRGDDLYVVLCLAVHDGTIRSQNASLEQFQQVLSTVRFTSR